MKKVLKFIGKAVACFLGGLIGLLAVLSVITLAWSGVQRARGSVFDELPAIPDDFKPAVRFAVYTDTHNKNENVADAYETLYRLYDNDEVYTGIDAVFGLGDFTSIGGEDNFRDYADTVKQYEREGTQLINILGNHEMKNKSACDYFRKYFGYEPNTVHEINGFTFICFSGSPALTEWTFSIKDLKWLSNEVDKASEKANNKPVFVMQHPHNFGTVYGSAVWCDPQLNPIYAGHSNVISFSGHSHFPMNDPRSINQSTYTSVGVGAMRTFELDKNYIVGQHPDGYDTAAQVCIVEADNNGRVAIREYDLNSDTFFNEYFIENVTDPSTFAYTYKNVKAHDSTPVFPENTAASAKKNENGEWVLSFNEAKSNYIVHHYNIKITDENGKKIYKDTFIDDYFVIDEDDTADFRIGSDTLVSGKTYRAEITAVSAYHLRSDKLTVSFTAE